MKKTAISVLMVAVLGAVWAGGCASAPKGPTDEEVIQKLIGDWKAAAVAKDLDKMLAGYSDAFQHPEWGDKAGLKNFLKEALDMGYLENAQVNTEKMQVKIEKDTATAYPIQLKAAFGSATIELNLKKEAKGWAVTGMTVEQY